jgi:hypothetical protein
MWAPLKLLCERVGVPARYNESKLKMTLSNGSTLRLTGADNKKHIEKLRGQPFHEVHIDEFASYSPAILSNLLYRIIGPRLGDYGGVLVMYGTPGHILRGPAYEATRPGSEIGRPYADRDEPEYKDWAGWSTHNWTLQDGAETVPTMRALWKEALLEKRTNRWSDDAPVWRREYLARWATDISESVFRYRPHLFGDDAVAAGIAEGAQWNQWSPPRDRNGFAVLPKSHEWRYVYGMDLGHSDPFALVVFAYSLTDRSLYQVYEYGKKGMTPTDIAKLLIGPELTHEPLGGLFAVTGYPEGIVADTAGLGGMLLAELQNVHGVRVEAAKKADKHDAIELFNGDLIDGLMKILKGSQLEAELQDLQWDFDASGRLREDPAARNDHSDAAVYARRCAMHKFAGELPPPEPLPGTAEALNAEMRRQEEEAARPRGAVDDLLADGRYSGEDGFGFEEEWWG